MVMGLTFETFLGSKDYLQLQSTGIGRSWFRTTVDFTLDDIDENWMPHLDSTGPDDKIAEAHFVLDPNSSNSSIEEFIFEWNDLSGLMRNPSWR